MKNIGIYNYVFSKDFIWDENGGSIGPSEVWSIMISNKLAEKGYNVYVFGNPHNEHITKNGITYLNCDSLGETCKNVKFSHIILNRTVGCLDTISNCDNIILMAQDDMILESDNGFEKEFSNKINKIMYLSEYQKDVMIRKYGLHDSLFKKTIEGIEMRFYDTISVEKKNKMVISGGINSNIRLFIERVFPLIRKEVPDFEVDACCRYNEYESLEYLKVDGVNVICGVSSEELAKRRLESKIWVYPNTGYDSEYNEDREMFSLDGIENAYAKNACIFGNFGCLRTIFEGYDGFVGDYLYTGVDKPIEYDNIDRFCELLSKEAIKCLKDENYRKNLVEKSYEISKKYTWDNAVCDFIDMFSDYEKDVMVYVITHKDFPYLINDDIHTILQVGAEINGDLGIGICDNTGDNISAKNKFFLDTTGVYWVWKNSKKYDYIGTQSYRRDFGLTKKEIVDILKTNDVIASPFLVPNSLYEQYKACHIVKDLETCEDIIKDLYPEYGNKFSNFIRSTNKLYIGCGCITSYEKYSDINGFIFSVLFELEKRYGFKTYEEWVKYAEESGQNLMPEDHKKSGLSAAEYQARLFGALYERLFTFYVCENYKSIYEKEYIRLDKEYEKMNTKVLLCCIGRLENQYIREYVEYNKSIGFTNICLYDNNRDGEDDFHDVIGDYIDSGYVILKNKRNITVPCQLQSYNECYEEYGDKYDWIAFFDIDEFMFMYKEKNVCSFLANEIYDGFNMIHLNWVLFGDDDNVYNNGLPLLQRIRKPLDINACYNLDFPESFHIKSIVRGGLKHMVFNSTPHTPSIDGKCCNSYGIECDKNSPFSPYDFRNGGIMHYTTKTAEEYANKVNRGFCDGNPVKKEELINLFFKRNKVTEEKVNIFKDKTGIDVSYLLPYNGHKSDDVKIYTLCYKKKNFKFLDDEVITPLQVGAANGTDICELKDNNGDNISDKNYFFIEGTGTYWIWKNVHDAKYKGQMQYRRPLVGVNDKMDFDEIFSKYDVITCEPFNHPANSKPDKNNPMFIPAQTVEEGYAFSNCLDDLLILELSVKYNFPDYSEDYDKYIKKGENLYYSNGFIMRSEDYDKYAEFMYKCLCGYLKFANINTKDDLFEHVRYNIETNKYIRYEKEKITDEGFKWQTEIGGFLSERLWTLWVQHNFTDDKIYKLPYNKMENNMYT